MTKLVTINSVQTPSFPTSQLRHGPELSLCLILQLNNYRQYNLAGKLFVVIRGAAEGETAGRDINDVIEVTNC